MKKLLLGICYFLITQIAISQTISGRVIDEEGHPIPSATVSLNKNLYTVTDEHGRFEFSKLKQGSYNLMASSVGMKEFTANISTGLQPLEVRLQRSGIIMDPIEIKAIIAGKDAPFTKTNISKREIEKTNLGQDLPFLLNQTPSVVVNSDAGNAVGYTGIRIRGSDATRINMTINGIPYNDAESQGLFFVNLPDLASSVNSIQIQRGVGTSSNGTGAFGATMNFSTNEVNEIAYGELNNSFGSFNTWKHTVKAGTGLIDNHFTVDARLSKIKSDGFIDRASTNLESFYLSAAWLSEKTSVRFNVLSGKEKTYQAWNGIPESYLKDKRTFNSAGTDRPGTPYDNETDNYKQDHYQLFVNHQFNKSLAFNTAFFLTKGKGYYEQYKAGESFTKYGLNDFVVGNDTLHETDLIRQLWLDNSFYGQIASLQYKGKSSNFTLGGGWSRYNGHHFGEIIWATAGVPDNYRWYDHKAYKTDVNIYGKYQQELIKTDHQSLLAFIDLQYRRAVYNIDGFRDNPAVNVHEVYNFFNPKLGLTYSHNGYQAYLSYSKGQKEPNRDDFEAGKNQLPKPEKLNDFELGISKRTNNFNWSVTAFYMLYKDQLVLTGQINDVGAYTRVNIPDSYRLGIELQAGARVSSWLNVAANLALSNNKVKNFTEYYDDYDNGGQKSITHGTTDIAYSPNVVAGGSINLLPVKNLELSLLSKYVSRQFLDNTSNKGRSLNAFFTEDARVSYSLEKIIFKEINLIFQVNNVFDKKYEPNGYTFSYQYGNQLVTENYYFPMAGVNFMIGVNIKL